MFFSKSSKFAESGGFFWAKILRFSFKKYYINVRFDRCFTEDLCPPLFFCRASAVTSPFLQQEGWAMITACTSPPWACQRLSWKFLTGVIWKVEKSRGLQFGTQVGGNSLNVINLIKPKILHGNIKKVWLGWVAVNQKFCGYFRPPGAPQAKFGEKVTQKYFCCFSAKCMFLTGLTQLVGARLHSGGLEKWKNSKCVSFLPDSSFLYRSMYCSLWRPQSICICSKTEHWSVRASLV